MAFKMTLWACGLLFIATVYNVAGAYDVMGGVDVQGKFEEVGLLHNGDMAEFPLPPRKPLNIQEVASN